MDKYHTSVLLSETIEHLQIREGEKYIDATLGGGGHTTEILKRGGRVLAVDVDDDALTFVGNILEEFTEDGRLIIAKSNFREIASVAKKYHFEQVNGILFDLGVSSHQLDTPIRGFSFANDGPLDMRMDHTLSVQAKDLVNGLTKQELADLFIRFGEERFAKQIAQRISEERLRKPFETTEELSRLIERIVRFKEGQTHPSTRVFQALRILVNDEMRSLEDALPQAVELLKNNGRLVVISFHSLEDRIVKHAFEKFETEGKGKVITKKPLIPTDQEVLENKRSRSSKLRVFERLL